MVKEEEKWYEEEEDEDSDEEDFPIEYNISSSPNDFNVMTIYDFLEQGVVKIPDFQRNYVWDIKRASKLVESLIIGLPVPQLFLYERAKNDFIVIDGQQRLMTIYYFVKKKFPRMEIRTELRRIFDENGRIPDNYLHDNRYFIDFNLSLPRQLSDRPNRLNGLNFSTLDPSDRMSLNIRTIRNVIIKQHSPPDDNSSMYEIFYRLNTGGVNLKPQEIRSSLYHSNFYKMLTRINLNSDWRRLTKPEPDLHMKDTEIILRGYAMLLKGETYKPSLVRFLNDFSEESKKLKDDHIKYLEDLFIKFLEKCGKLQPKAFFIQSNQFNVSLYEAVFRVVCEKAYSEKNLELIDIDSSKLEELKQDDDFLSAIRKQTTSKKHVQLRLDRAREILSK